VGPLPPSSKSTKGDDKGVNSVAKTSTRGLGAGGWRVPLIDEQLLRPEKVQHTANAKHDARALGKLDQQSIESNDSRQMIIKKKVECSVKRGYDV
jgi:hypothetical protein